MSNQEDFLRKARMAALMAADDDEGKDVAPAADEDALVSEKTKENLKKAGALAAVAGRWGFGKAKEVTKAAAEKASAAKVEFEAKRAASAKRKAEEALAVETKALAEREAALPVAEAPPMAVAPVQLDAHGNFTGDSLLLYAGEMLRAYVGCEESKKLPDEERQWSWTPHGLQKMLELIEADKKTPTTGLIILDGNGSLEPKLTLNEVNALLKQVDSRQGGEGTTDSMAKAGASDGEPSGLLILDGMGSLPATLPENLIDIEVQAPGQGVSLDDMSGEDVEAAMAALTSVPESTAPVAVLQGKAGVGMTIINELAGSLSKANNPGQKIRKDFSAVEVFWIGILTATFATLIVIYLLNRETSAPVATPAPVAPQAAPITVEPVSVPIESPVEEPAETLPEVVETPAVVAPPVAQETQVAAPAPKPTPAAPVVQAPKPAPVAVVAKPKPAPMKPAPVVVAKPKPAPKVVAPVVKDPDKQLEEMEAWFEKRNQK